MRRGSSRRLEASHGKTGRSGLTTYILLTGSAFIAAGPIVGVMLIALNPPNSLVPGLLPSHAGLQNIQQTWEAGAFGRALMWSAITTAGTIVLSTPLAVPAGYALAKMRFPGRRALFYLFLFGVLLPYACCLIPAYYELRKVLLTGTPWAVILPSAATSVAFGVFWMRSAFLGVPKELLEEARVDGAREFTVLVRVALPIVRSAILVLVLLTFLWTWNSFLVPLVMLAGSGIQTGTMAMALFQSVHEYDVPALAASALFISAPVMLVYVLTQRYFVRGITEGALVM